MLTDQPTTEEVFLINSIDFTNAKQSESESWIENKVYKVVKRTNQPYISLRWVCSTKQTKEGLKLKARLVARGFEEECLSKSEIQSPTCSKDTFRLILSLTVQKR